MNYMVPYLQSIKFAITLLEAYALFILQSLRTFSVVLQLYTSRGFQYTW